MLNNSNILISEINSSLSTLISKITYNIDTKNLTINFRSYYIEEETYLIEPELYQRFITSKSKGRFYLNNKQFFNTHKKSNHMADKIIKLKIDVTKINKEWLYKGEKGTYLSITALFNEQEDGYGNNGLIVQDVPTEVYKKDKTVKGDILGNCKDFTKTSGTRNEEAKPGVEAGKAGGALEDDLPF